MRRSTNTVAPRAGSGLFLFIVSILTLGIAPAAANAEGAIHGPILTWHERPTETITVTWVERVNGHAAVDGSKQWRVGRAGFGYGDDDDRTRLRDMEDKYGRVYIRRTFTLDGEPGEPGEAAAVLHIRYDDAFIAYLNGQEIARRGVGKGRGAEASDIKSHEAGGGYEAIEIDNWAKLAKRGANVLAIEGHNTSLGSSDLTLDPYLTLRAKGDDGKAKELIARHDLWDYLAGADPRGDWTAVTFDPPGDAPTAAEVARAAEKEKDEEPGFMQAVVWVKRAGGDDDWRRVAGKSRPFADTGGKVHAVHIEGLSAGTEYAVAIGATKPADAKNAQRFVTAPAKLTGPIRFVTGGDMGVGSVAQAINRQAGKAEALFALLGGDLAYANGRDAGKWYAWLDNWKQQAVSPDGRALPIVICIGNHEMGSQLSEAEAKRLGTHPRSKFFFSLFTLPDGRSNYTLDFGDYLSLFILDSDHAQRVGDQTDWLAKVLAERAKVPHTFACYHRPAYGTAKSPNTTIREQWAPLFEKHNVDAVFENDHHTYKRSFPIRAGKVDHERGVLYLGDGAWGVGTRRVPDLSLREKDPDARVDPKTKQEIWHLARAESRNHLWRVTVSPQGVRYEAIDKDGKVFDRWPAEAE